MKGKETVDLHKYYKEHKDDINSSIMEIAADLATARLKDTHNLPFEAFVEPENQDDPDNDCTRFKDEYQDEFNWYYDEEYNRIASLIKFDYAAEDGVTGKLIESKATEIKTTYATVRYDIENITGASVSDEDIDDVLDRLHNDTKIVGDFIVNTEICGRND